MKVIDPNEAYLLNGQVRAEKLDDLLVEVCGGRRLFTVVSRGVPQCYATRGPTHAEQEQARLIYAKNLQLLIADGVPTRQQMIDMATRNGFMDQRNIKLKQDLMSVIQSNMQARNNSNDPQQKLMIDEQLEGYRKRLMKIESSEESIIGNAAESTAEASRTDFFVFLCTYGGELLDQRVWPTWDDFQGCSNQALVRAATTSLIRLNAGLSTKVLRALARSSEWRIRWQASQESNAPLFEGPSAAWTRNQVGLAYWSDFYANVYRHPECPSEIIIGDDDALHNWMNMVIAKAKAGRRGTGAQGRKPTYIDGNGQRKEMVSVGGHTIQVNQPYRVRTKQMAG